MIDLLLKKDPALEHWLNKPVPRYTSYPPAPTFHKGVGRDAYIKSLGAIPPQESMSLYLHVPFCRELCLYCGCHTSVTRKPERINAYLDRLIKEVMGTIPHFPSRKLGTIHFGGGTPNILSNQQFEQIFTLLRSNFDLSPDTEIAIELDPRHITEEQVRVLAACGVNRVSLGIQDFSEPVQQLINRHQPYKLVAQRCEWLRKHGITRINFDLIYGLPLQTIESVAQTATDVIGLEPDRIALFSYAHVPQMKKHQVALEDAGIPDQYTRLMMDSAARAIFCNAGYLEIGMDHFARPHDPLVKSSQQGTLHRNFQGYTTDKQQTLLAFGASAISQTKNGFFQNERDITTYQESIDLHGHATMHGVILSQEDQVRAAIIEELMCQFSCDVPDICKSYNFPIERLDSAIPTLQHLQAAGLIRLQGGRISLLSPFRMAIRVVANAFDSYATAKIVSKAA